MAAVRLTPQVLNTTGQAVTRQAMATADNYIVLIPPSGIVLNFIKTGAGEATITVITPGTVDGLAITDRPIVVAATTGDVVALFFPDHYANSVGDLDFTTSEDTAITVAAFQG